MAMKARVFVVDDHPIVRAGLAPLINQESDLHVCGEAADAASAFEGIEALKPDVAVVDLSLHGPDGLELVKNLRARNVPVPVVILSMHHESLYAERALRAGARAYLMKQEAAERGARGTAPSSGRRHLCQRSYGEPAARANVPHSLVPGRLAPAMPERPGAGRLPSHRSGPQHPSDC